MWGIAFDDRWETAVTFNGEDAVGQTTLDRPCGIMVVHDVHLLHAVWCEEFWAWQ